MRPSPFATNERSSGRDLQGCRSTCAVRLRESRVGEITRALLRGSGFPSTETVAAVVIALHISTLQGTRRPTVPGALLPDPPEVDGAERVHRARVLLLSGISLASSVHESNGTVSRQRFLMPLAHRRLDRRFGTLLRSKPSSPFGLTSHHSQWLGSRARSHIRTYPPQCGEAQKSMRSSVIPLLQGSIASPWRICESSDNPALLT